MSSSDLTAMSAVPLLDDVKFDLCDTVSNHSQFFGRSIGNIDDPTADKRAAVIDADRH